MGLYINSGSPPIGVTEVAVSISARRNSAECDENQSAEISPEHKRGPRPSEQRGQVPSSGPPATASAEPLY